MTEPKVMTFKEFQATRRECADIGEAIGCDMYCADPGQKVTGFLYLDSLYIENVTDEDARKRGIFYLILMNEAWVTDDLVDLERKLYVYACSEQLCAAPTVTLYTEETEGHLDGEQAMRRDPLAEALRSNDLDETVRTIQAALGITTGDVAGQCFSDKDRATYKALDDESYGEDLPYARAQFIRGWLHAELNDAAARAVQS